MRMKETDISRAILKVSSFAVVNNYPDGKGPIDLAITEATGITPEQIDKLINDNGVIMIIPCPEGVLVSRPLDLNQFLFDSFKDVEYADGAKKYTLTIEDLMSIFANLFAPCLSMIASEVTSRFFDRESAERMARALVMATEAACGGYIGRHFSINEHCPSD
jgi:hypothetical protein